LPAYVCECFQIVIVAAPCGIHDANYSVDFGGGLHPFSGIADLAIVVTRDYLSMASVSKELERLVAFFEVPVDDDDIFVETFPGAAVRPPTNTGPMRGFA
jgi:hypothetical protein